MEDSDVSLTESDSVIDQAVQNTSMDGHTGGVAGYIIEILQNKARETICRNDWQWTDTDGSWEQKKNRKKAKYFEVRIMCGAYACMQNSKQDHNHGFFRIIQDK
jgi:hypothetical protein